jgi:hypothetical protein
MNGSIARRVALAASAFAFVISVISSPASALAANTQDRPPAPRTPTPSPAPYIIYPPDIQVVSLGVFHHQGPANDSYFFKVRNIGQGPAKKLKLKEEAEIRLQKDHSYVKTYTFDYVHVGSLNPGGEFMVEVSCPIQPHQYCNFGTLEIELLEQIVLDSNPNNNIVTNNDNIMGKPTL